MGNFSKVLPIVFLALFTIFPCTFEKKEKIQTRETLEIIIGGGEGDGSDGEEYAPAPGPKCGCPSPSIQVSDINPRLQMAIEVIQNFKKIVTSDPKNITKTWVGPKICDSDKKYYKGFFCDTLEDDPNKYLRVASVDFNGFNLGAPSIEGLLDKLEDAAIFHINSNKFQGTIPYTSHLNFLYELDVSNNYQTGCFPTNVLPLKNLLFLDLRFNSYNGIIPSDLFDLTLEVIFLNNNNFNGEIPQNLGNSPVLYLTLANNFFTGPIPNSIGKMSNTLIEVLFLNNKLSGCLPYEIGFLKELTVFDAGNNRLTGPIPFSFGCMKNLEQLNLANNQLYGVVPEVLCAINCLKNLSLSNNYFTELGPKCLNLAKDRKLDDRNNCILGRPNQRSAQECLNFYKEKRKCQYPFENYIKYDCAGFQEPYSIHSQKYYSERASRVHGDSPTYAALQKEYKHKI